MPAARVTFGTGARGHYSRYGRYGRAPTRLKGATSLRFPGDHPEQSPRCRALVVDLETDTLRAWTSHLVVAEVVYLLARIYRFERQQVADVVLPIIELTGLKIPRKRLFRRVFELFTTTALTLLSSCTGGEKCRPPRRLLRGGL